MKLQKIIFVLLNALVILVSCICILKGYQTEVLTSFILGFLISLGLLQLIKHALSSGPSNTILTVSLGIGLLLILINYFTCGVTGILHPLFLLTGAMLAGISTLIDSKE